MAAFRPLGLNLTVGGSSRPVMFRSYFDTLLSEHFMGNGTDMVRCCIGRNIIEQAIEISHMLGQAAFFDTLASAFDRVFVASRADAVNF